MSEFSSPQNIALLVSVRGVSEFSSPQDIALFVSVTGVSEFYSSPQSIALLVSVIGVSSSFMKLGFTYLHHWRHVFTCYHHRNL